LGWLWCASAHLGSLSGTIAAIGLLHSQTVCLALPARVAAILHHADDHTILADRRAAGLYLAYHKVPHSTADAATNNRRKRWDHWLRLRALFALLNVLNGLLSLLTWAATRG
jgi:hypothetical protein